ncbi:MAG TPA: LytTR family DNA-binding domain-containing protein [Clostridia bacterium]|nr:LytTR family DNA-binding domain-containing protein [Clostridia bacterium]
MSIRVLIADDEPGMRLVLKKAIERCSGLDTVGEAEDGEAALRLFETLRPDVVFMDVEMPKLSGVECAKRISDIDPKTIIIFATAHDEYMPEAFEVYAFDYLVKPFRLERLNQTLERIGNTGLGKPDLSVVNRPNSHTVAPQKLMIRNKDSISLVDVKDIILIQREDRSTVIYTGTERFSTSEGLTEIGVKLDKDLFFRSHKSYIINLGAVSKIYPYGRWTYIVKLEGIDKDALLTHDKYEELSKMFE